MENTESGARIFSIGFANESCIQVKLNNNLYICDAAPYVSFLVLSTISKYNLKTK